MKLFAKFVLVLLLAGSVALVVLNQNVIARMRSERQTLMSADVETTRLAEQNKSIEQLRAANGEAEELRQANKELPRLRNEIHQLRRQSDTLEKLRAENKQLQAAQKNVGNASAMPADFIPRTALAESGLATPEAAARTFLWAMTQGNLERVEQCRVDGSQRNRTVAQAEKERDDLQKQAADFPGFRIAERTDDSPTEVTLLIQASVGGVKAPMKMKLVGTEWKVE